jgi:hypothetical protein
VGSDGWPLDPRHPRSATKSRDSRGIRGPEDQGGS